MKGKLIRIAAIVSMTLAAMTGSMAARAEHVQAETPWYSGVPLQSLANGVAGSAISSSQLVWGTSLSVNALATTGRGQVTVRLTDIGWPDALSSLSLLVTDLNGLWHKIDGNTGADGLIFNLNGPANLFVAVYAKSQSKWDPGLYHLQADFSPVPLPAAAWLLLSGLGGLAAFRRKRLLDR
ncbi:MAG: VPLPA-CTERM sorting domain-containing protein [Steroidobacter sp.]